MLCRFSILLHLVAAMLLSATTVAQEHTAPAFPENMAWPAWAKPPAVGVAPVTGEEARKWLRWVIPLPKRVRIEAKLPLSASEIGFRLRGAPSDVAQAAVDRLASRLRQKTGVKQFGGRFPVIVGVCDAQGRMDGVPIPGADQLAKCRNADQAYLTVRPC